MGMAPENTTTTIPVNVGVVLDMGHWTGKMQLSCIRMALSDFYEYSHGHYKTRLVLKTRDSKDDVVGAAAAALLFRPFKIPILFRAVQNDASQVRAISSIVQAFGWTQVVPIYVENEFGEGIMPFLADALQEIKARIPLPNHERLELNGSFGHRFNARATALAMAVEKVDAPSTGFQMTNSLENSTDLEAFGSSRMGPKLLQALLNTTTFGGLGGDFQIVDGDLRSSGYEIVNVIGNGRNVIGFWTPQEGIVRELNGTSTTTYSTSKASLGSIIWPGDTTTPPKGWELARERSYG
ncbi:glutamate receptor 2.6 [Actinidia rufa]|uniref:Glutamate receptor 2.6 n=1 Tax=Actinidia rufa TaxID=165716 RepID=A0A7J0GBN9_9ERIC|nr:glutamate receptor 2.6 [Actinidia rufa]